MRRPHLPILIGDCVSRHGQLHPGQTSLVYWASHRNLAWGENVVVVILYWLMRETRQISDISCLSRDECCSLEMLREINNKLLWYCSNPLITGGVTPATARKLGSSCWPSAKWAEKNPQQWENKEVYEAFMVNWVVRDVGVGLPLLYCVIFIYICLGWKKTDWGICMESVQLSHFKTNFLPAGWNIEYFMP